MAPLVHSLRRAFPSLLAGESASKGRMRGNKINKFLMKGEVHVWEASLAVSSSELKRLQEILSPDEKERAQRFVFEKDRHHFIAARGILRDILSSYLDVSASELEFAYGEQGKPFLKAAPLPLEFNLSHSHGLALYAVTLNQPLGIDLELFNKETQGIDLAKRFFHLKEFQELSALPESLQQQSFFNYWVLKEAVVKAMGNGLFLSLDRFVVSHLPDESAKLLEIDSSIEKAADWTLCSLEVKEGYVAALAVLGKIRVSHKIYTI